MSGFVSNMMNYNDTPFLDNLNLQPGKTMNMELFIDCFLFIW